MTYATIKVDQAKAEEIRDFYHCEIKRDEKNPYIYFIYESPSFSLQCFRSRKEVYSLVFSSKSDKAILEAEQFSKNITIKKVEENTKITNHYSTWEDLSNQIGSDEVGVGDFFGPLVVCSAYIDSKDIDFLKKMKIDDSKKMTDEYILDIGLTIKKRIKNHVAICSAEKLSSLHEVGFNMHKIMAVLHNFTQKKLIERYSLTEETIIYIDRFEKEENYRRYLKDEIVNNLLFFRINGETYYPSIAVASVIARYTFLKEFQKIEKEFNTTIPKGASALVDKTFSILCKEYGNEKVSKYVKKYFRNYKNSSI